MFIIIAFAIGFMLFAFPRFRVFVLNLYREPYIFLKDIYLYIKEKKWRVLDEWGIDVFTGYFGKGKTLCAVHKVRKLKKRYPYIKVYSNIKLIDVPYIPLVDVNQIIDCEGDSVFLIDEMQTLFNSRRWKDFNANLFSCLCQCRKKGKRKYVVATAQRFQHIDKAIRDVCRNVYDCNKFWRLQGLSKYDAWEIENAINFENVKSLSRSAWFVTNKDFNAYDTDELVEQFKTMELINNEEIINRNSYDLEEYGIKRISRKLKKKMKR